MNSENGTNNGANHWPAEPRHDWSVDEILTILKTPLIELVHRAQVTHREWHEEGTVQLASLMSIKTGACPEDCKYCPQSAHYAKTTKLEKERLVNVDIVLASARSAKEAGATRFCMGPPGAKCATGRNSTRFWKWFLAYAKWGWKPA